MDYGFYAILVLLIGLAILVAEFFIPSGGALAVVSIACLGASVYCAWEAWWDVNRSYWWIYISSVVVAFPATLAFVLWLFPRTALGKRVLGELPDARDSVPYQEEIERLEALIGHTGTAMTLMNPGGMVKIGNERIHADSRGMMLDPGDPIEVVGVKGNRLVVRKADPERIADTQFQAAAQAMLPEESTPDDPFALPPETEAPPATLPEKPDDADPLDVDFPRE